MGWLKSKFKKTVYFAAFASSTLSTTASASNEDLIADKEQEIKMNSFRSALYECVESGGTTTLKLQSLPNRRAFTVTVKTGDSETEFGALPFGPESEGLFAKDEYHLWNAESSDSMLIIVRKRPNGRFDIEVYRKFISGILIHEGVQTLFSCTEQST